MHAPYYIYVSELAHIQFDVAAMKHTAICNNAKL